MNRALLLTLLFTLPWILDCREEEEFDWPVWILYASATTYGELGDQTAVSGCPSLTWHYVGHPESETVHCYNGNWMKAWRHIDTDVNIVYQVRCDGYWPSDWLTAAFPLSQVHQGPGRDGAEAIVVSKVVLLAQ